MSTPEIEIPPCGVHCGVMAGRTGHCDCELCHDGSAPVVFTRSDLLTTEPKASMCDQWYAGIGDYRPWHAGQHQPPPPLPTPQEMLARLTGDNMPYRAALGRAERPGHPPRAVRCIDLPPGMRGPAGPGTGALARGPEDDRRMSAPQQAPESLACPQCGDKTFLDAADPDDDLAAFWHHLGAHTQDQLGRLRLWTAAMGGRGAGGP